ncbi:MAG: PilZ domain-containing protein, partial [Erythrobacter sp.]
MLRTRTSERVRSRATGSCRTERGQDCDVRLDDLSQGGCRLDDPKGMMRLGAIVSLSIAGTGPHAAEVAWRQSDRVGLEFRRPLPE